MRATLRQLVAIMSLVALASGCSLAGRRDLVDAQASNVDINTAGRDALERLPGLTPADVDRIIKNRPYANKRELVDRGILDQRKFNDIRDDLATSQPGRYLGPSVSFR